MTMTPTRKRDSSASPTGAGTTSRYLDIAIQYYLAGRCAIFAGSFPVAGNLFHHSAEMLLKHVLLEHYSADYLRIKFRHNLGKLWREFKNSTANAALGAFDGLVSRLNKIEQLRYPGPGYAFTIEQRKGSPLPRASGPAMKGLRQHDLNLEEFDEFVTTVLTTDRINPKGFEMCLRTADAKAQYERDNLHIFK